MHPAAAKFLAFPPERKRDVHLELCERALLKWHSYSRFRPWLWYMDSVVGMPHRVDRRLPFDALECARLGRDTLNVAERYKEPVVALQDDDFNLPNAIEFAYYAIYNVFRKYALNHTIDDWLIVNQALSIEKKTDKVVALLEEVVQ